MSSFAWFMRAKWGAAAHDIMDRAKSIELREHIDLERHVTWRT